MHAILAEGPGPQPGSCDTPGPMLYCAGSLGVHVVYRFGSLFLAVSILVTLFLRGLGQPPSAHADGERLVLAFYYPWFDANTWNSGTVPDIPASPYNSDDPGVMARQIAQAQGAGIDAFVLNWWGVKNRTEKNLKALLDVAGGKGFRVSAVFDLNSPVMGDVGSYAENLRHLHSVHAAHPAYLRYQGRPVVFFYNVSRLSAATWQSLRDQSDPGRAAIWIAEGTDLNYQSVFDGHHLYSVTWPNKIAPTQTLPKWGNRVLDYNQVHDSAKLWVATVMPGYDDRKVRPKSGFARSRDGGDYYRQCWQAAISSRPDWVIINSFNEWPEGSYIEPSQAYGDLFLGLTRDWAAQFKQADFSVAPAPGPEAVQKPPAGAVPPGPTPMPAYVDYALEDGWFFTQGSAEVGKGFAVSNKDGVPFWNAYRDAGGPLSIDFPTSHRYRWDGFVLQSFQSGLLAWHPDLGRVQILERFDEALLAGLLAACR
ncbi:endo-1,3-alpha-glucanase family glycosylhydrolase [Chloroflexota bacterium]